MPSSRQQFAQHVRVSSTEDLSYNIPTGTGGTKDVIQTIVTGRKCWKTMKGRGEVVWPPHLEAALVEGLEQYRPVETRSTRALGRFPMRNKFISEYIFKATGKRRTPKQVGSRLQQLRDTCEGKRILKLLSSRPAESPKPDEASSSPEASATPSAASPVCDQVTIDVLPSEAYWPYGDFGTIPSPQSATSAAASSSTTSPSPNNIPRPLRAIDSTVTFRSRSPVNAYSSFRVLRDGQVFHREDTELEMRSSSCMPAQQWPAEMECIFYYSTRLVPRLWSTLCEKNDLTAYSIIQDIVRTPPASETEGSTPPTGETILSVVYNFKTVTTASYSSRAHSPASTSVSADADNLSYSTESTPEFDEFLTTLHDNRQASHAYTHQQTSPQLAATLPPFHALQSQLPSNGGGAFEQYPPELIRDGEDGYTSLPQSPLDFAFPTAIAAAHQIAAANVVVADASSANELVDLSRSYIGVSVDAHPQGCYGHDLSLNVQPTVPMLPDIHYGL
ncbi:hypothetical protein EIP91_002722 [Steccherinum ochraceum]|uniref:TEA domain-containing protein n=1 Tax=Steccherinum ochraceum TaxID=92696 RepID=A0A4R0RK44_9APHY|nr:hypothetical protein EIP91_002722 [Steccherinum ochraceum]